MKIKNLEALQNLKDTYDLNEKFIEYLFVAVDENLIYIDRILDSLEYDDEFSDQVRELKFKTAFTNVLHRVHIQNDYLFGYFYKDELFDRVMVKYDPKIKVPKIK